MNLYTDMDWNQPTTYSVMCVHNLAFVFHFLWKLTGSWDFIADGMAKNWQHSSFASKRKVGDKTVLMAWSTSVHEEFPKGLDYNMV